MTQVQNTSKVAYKAIKNSLAERQSSVFNAIKFLKNPTNSEIAKYLNIPINRVTGRVHELRGYKLVKNHGRRNCSITGHTALTWTIVKENEYEKAI